jgi:hypothetical protein
MTDVGKKSIIKKQTKNTTVLEQFQNPIEIS